MPSYYQEKMVQIGPSTRKLAVGVYKIILLKSRSS